MLPSTIEVCVDTGRATRGCKGVSIKQWKLRSGGSSCVCVFFGGVQVIIRRLCGCWDGVHDSSKDGVGCRGRYGVSIFA
jgi:hypothetical protein